MGNPADLSTLPAPAEIIHALSRYRDALASAAGDHLLSLVLYGGLARGRYRAGRSDINLALVSRDDFPAYLAAVAPILRDAFREIRLEPFLLTQSELPRAAHMFPIKMLDIQRRHILLLGPDPFTNLSINPRDVVRQVEQELRNLAMRLRRRYIAAGPDDRLIRAALDDAAVTLRIDFLAMFDLAHHAPPDDNTSSTVFDQAARLFHLDAHTLATLAAVRNNGIDNAPDYPALLTSVITLTSRAADAATSMEVSA